MGRTPIRFQRTSPSSQDLRTFGVDVPRGAFGSGVASALSALGPNIARAGALFQQRADRTRNFVTATSFAKFSSGMNESLAELQRTYDPASQNFTEEAEELYRVRAENFLADNVPPDLQDEYRLRLERQRGSVVGEALKFQYTTGDDFFRREIDDVYQGALTAVRVNPDSFDDESEKLADAILTSDLADTEKLQLTRDLRRGLQGVRYTGLVQSGRADPNIIWSGDGTIDSYLNNLRAAESGGDDSATADTSTATGRFQFTAGTWKGLIDRYPDAGLTIDGRTDPAQQEIGIRLFTAENVEVLNRSGLPATHPNLHAVHLLGKGDGPKVLAASDETMLKDIVSPASLKANAFLRNMSVADFKAFVAQKQRGTGEVDPRFADLSYSQRDTLFNQATAQRAREARARQQEFNNQQQATFEDTFTSILNNSPDVSRQTVIGMNTTGALNASQTRQLLTALDSERAVSDAQTNLTRAQQTGVPADPSDANNRKAADQRLTSSFQHHDTFQNAIRQGDPSAIEQGFALSASTGVIPPLYASGLTGLLGSSNPAHAVTAANSITQLARRNSLSANQAFNSSTLQRAALLKNTADRFGVERANEIAGRMLDPALQGQVDQLRDIGQKRFAERLEELPSFSHILAKAGFELTVGEGIADFFGFEITVPPQMQAQFTAEYRDAWTTAYSLTGSEETADDWVTESLTRFWGFSDIGGTRNFMKYPVEKATPGWTPELRDIHVRASIGAGEDDRIQLVATSQTESRVLRGLQPTYQAVNRDTFEMYTAEDGTAQIIDFTVTPERLPQVEKAAEIENSDNEVAILEDRLFEAQARLREIDNFHRQQSILRNPAVDEEEVAVSREQVGTLEEELERARENIKRLRKELSNGS